MKNVKTRHHYDSHGMHYVDFEYHMQTMRKEQLIQELEGMKARLNDLIKEIKDSE